MKKQYFFIIFLSFIFLVCTAETKKPNIRKVLMIGIDGIETSAFALAKLPNIQQLMKNGSYSTKSKIYGPRFHGNESSSGPGWSSILTGVWPDKHGVLENSMVGNRFIQYPTFFSRINEQHPAKYLVSLITWHPIKTDIVNDADFSASFEKPPYRTLKGVAAFREYDNEATNKAIYELENNNPDLLFIHLAECDAAGHEFGFGPEVKEYVNALEYVDTLIGQILTAVRKRKSYSKENWLNIVVSDHGGRDKSHGSGYEVPQVENTILVVSGKDVKKGELEDPVYIVDASVTALSHMRIKIKPEWSLDGRAVGIKQAS